MPEFAVVIERDEEGVYIASVPAVKGCHTQGASVEEALENVKEAILLCLEDDDHIRQPLAFVDVQKAQV